MSWNYLGSLVYLRKALETGIVEGQKLIAEKIQNLGNIVNGWSINLEIGDYGTAPNKV